MSRLKELRTPVFWAEGHPGKLDQEAWGIEVSGLCANSKTFTWQELTVLPKAIANARLTSVTRFSVRGRWGGVKIADLFDEVQVILPLKTLAEREGEGFGRRHTIC